MNDPASPSRNAAGARSFASRLFGAGLVATNVGLLVGLVFGPNSGRPNGALFGVGIGLLAVGLVGLAVAAYFRRRDSAPPRVGA
jgi:hypothetical protein